MDAASDSPDPETAARALTPMMAQYFEIKAANPDCLLVLPDGRFLRIVLRRRGNREPGARHRADQARQARGRGHPDVRRAGRARRRLSQPPDRARPSRRRLRADSKTRRRRRSADAKSVVQRDVVRLVTPGTITEERLLEPGRARLLVAVQKARSSEGRQALRARRARSFDRRDLRCSETDEAGLAAEIARLEPSEIVASQAVFDEPAFSQIVARDARSRDAARAGRRRRRGGRAPGLRVLRRRNPRRLRRLHPRRDRRRRARAGLCQAHPVRRPARALAPDAAGARDEPRDRSGDPRQSRTHAHLERRARRLAAGDDRPHRDARRRAPARRAAGESADRPGGDQPAARFARFPGRGGADARRLAPGARPCARFSARALAAQPRPRRPARSRRDARRPRRGGGAGQHSRSRCGSAARTSRAYARLRARLRRRFDARSRSRRLPTICRFSSATAGSCDPARCRRSTRRAACATKAAA